MVSMAPVVGVNTNMRVCTKTLERLAKRRKFLESYDTIVNAALDKLETLEAEETKRARKIINKKLTKLEQMEAGKK